MPRFAANLSMLFTEHPFLDRFAAAAQTGFRTVEFQFPYDHPVADVAARVQDNGLEVALFNLPPGNFAGGERGIACLPGREDEFRRGIDVMLTYAQAVNCRKINCLAGIRPDRLDVMAANDCLIGNLAHAASALAREDMMLLIEPINAYDIPGFLLNRSSEALAIMAAVAAPNLKLQYDVYHMQRMEGELTATMSRLAPVIGHMQIADAPARHEPGSGEINFAHVLRHIDLCGYDGWVGCEYRPKTTTLAGLYWLADLGYHL